MVGKKYDFAGWVTKNDILCDDGRTIKHGAFVDSPVQVPLIWMHDISSPENVIGNVELVHSAEGVYGYGTFNSTPSAEHAKAMVDHGDINAMSIRAKNITEQAKDVIHGIIHEVSLVMRGANPGAMIDTIISHDSGTEDEHIIYTGLELLHSAASEAPTKEEPTVVVEPEVTEDTLEDVLATFDEKQTQALEVMIGMAVDIALDEEGAPEDDDTDNEEGDGTDMKHNAFEGQAGKDYTGADVNVDTNAIIKHAAETNGTLKHAAKEYGIENISLLFPDAKNTKGIHIMQDKNTNVTKILGSISKSPFSFVKTVIADLDEKYMRAKGYVTASKKYEDVFKLLTRKVTPTTIYKKQKLDRDDIVDITEVNVPILVQGTMKPALEKELVRAVLIGDGRAIDDKDKVNEANIIPIIKDDSLYTKKYELEKVEEVLESVMYALTKYQGEGTPSLYCSPTLAISLKLLKSGTGKYLFGEIPTLEAMASKMGVQEIVPTSILSDNQIIIVNLSDYELGTSNGGEITNFDDFDIDFNQYKYLIETRLSGALTIPNSAIYITVKEAFVTKPSMLVELDGDVTPPSGAPEEGDLGQE